MRRFIPKSVFVGIIILYQLCWAQQQTHHGSPNHLKCHQLGLCSLGQVKPFLGDIYDSKAPGAWPCADALS